MLYRFAILNAGDSTPEIRLDFTFTPITAGAQTFTAYLPNGTTVTGDVTRPTVVATQPNPPVITNDQGVRIFAGPREDPFFFDAVGFNRVLAGGSFRGEDSFAGFNLSAIVIELPFSLVSGGGSNNKIEVTGITYTAFKQRAQALLNAPSTARGGKTFFQADRTGNPAIATALVPGGQRDAFNYAPVRGTGDSFAGINFTDVLVASLTNVFKTPPANIAILASVAVPDTMKFDISQPSGFPNGRRLQDDVIDTVLQLALGDPAASDDVDRNDRRFLSRFPYLAPPRQAN